MLTINGKNEQFVTPLRKSIDKEYFLGQSPDLSLASGVNGYAELFNPVGSGVNVHLNVWTTTNVSSKNYTIRVIFEVDFPVALDVAPDLTSSNLIEPKPTPNAQIRYKSGTTEAPGGIEIYTRRVPQESTVVSEEDGKFIIPPGKGIGLFAHETTASGICRVAYGWWEQPV